jgi:hypothetical protein
MRGNFVNLRVKARVMSVFGVVLLEILIEGSIEVLVTTIFLVEASSQHGLHKVTIVLIGTLILFGVDIGDRNMPVGGR